MAYKKATLVKNALKAIEEHNLMFRDDINTYIGICRTTFYGHKLDEVDSINSALQKNRVSTKVKLRTNWEKSKAPALQIALMRLICDDDERKKLSMRYNEITGKDGSNLFGDIDEKEAQKIAEKIAKADA